MAAKQRQVLLLGVLVVLLGVVLYTQWPSTGGPAPPTDARATVPRAERGAAGAVTGGAPDVRLEALDADRPSPSGADRNLFKFKPRPVPVEAPRLQAPAVSAPTGPPPPPPVPPIAMRFLGILENPKESQKIAVLTDGRGVYHGSEGDIIEGRYRILRIGVESIEMAYLDGQGRQTIRKSGS